MGVKGLWRLLLPIGRRISIETLEGKVLAIDASIWLTQFLSVAASLRRTDVGDDLRLVDDNGGSGTVSRTYSYDYLVGFLRRICKLRYQGIRPVFVFDGATPEIKQREIQARRRRQKRKRESFLGGGMIGGVVDDDDNNGEEGIKRLAKRILVQQLKLSSSLSSTGVPTTATGGAGRPTLISSAHHGTTEGSNVDDKDDGKTDQDSSGSLIMNGGMATTNVSYAAGFYDPEGIQDAQETIEKDDTPSRALDSEDRQDDVKDLSGIISSGKKDDGQARKSSFDPEIIALLDDDEYLQEDIADESGNDWDAADKVATGDNDDDGENIVNKNGHTEEEEESHDGTDRPRKPKKLFRKGRRNKSFKNTSSYTQGVFHAGDGTDFMAEAVASLDSNQRKDIVEDAQMNRRLQSRREFLKVASDPEALSQCQLRNFLKSTKLNQDISRMARLSAAQQEEQEDDADDDYDYDNRAAGSKGYQNGHRRRDTNKTSQTNRSTFAGGSRTRKVFFEKDADKVRPTAKSKEAELAKYRQKKLSLLYNADDDDDDDDNSSDEIDSDDHGGRRPHRTANSENGIDVIYHFAGRQRIDDDDNNSSTSEESGRKVHSDDPKDQGGGFLTTTTHSNNHDHSPPSHAMSSRRRIHIHDESDSDEVEDSKRPAKDDATIAQEMQDEDLARALQEAEDGESSDIQDSTPGNDVNHTRSTVSQSGSKNVLIDLQDGLNKSYNHGYRVGSKMESKLQDIRCDDFASPQVKFLGTAHAEETCASTANDEYVSHRLDTKVPIVDGSLNKNTVSGISSIKDDNDDGEEQEEEEDVDWEDADDHDSSRNETVQQPMNSQEHQPVGTEKMKQIDTSDEDLHDQNDNDDEDDEDVDWEDASLGNKDDGNVGSAFVPTASLVTTRPLIVEPEDDSKIREEAREDEELEESGTTNFGFDDNDWGQAMPSKTKSSKDINDALAHAQATAANLTNWAGRAFRRAVAQHAEENGMEIPEMAKPTILIDDLTHNGSVQKQPSPSKSGYDSLKHLTNERDQNQISDPFTTTVSTNRVKSTELADNSKWFGELDKTGLANGTFHSSMDHQEQGPERDIGMDSRGVTDEMRQEVMQLLRLFGIPYVVAPAEAEAQCVMLEKLKLVDGIVTEDSDAFVFGGQVIYKNIFDDQKYVEVYHSKDAAEEMNLNRNALVALAMLLGGDYTDGVKGVGIVNGMEVLHAFDVAKDCQSGLLRFRKWLDGFDPLNVGQPQKLNEEDEENDVLSKEQVFHWKHQSARTRWIAPKTFPDIKVLTAYLNPVVDNSREQFSWGVPDLDGLVEFCKKQMGWTLDETKGLVGPVIKQLEGTTMRQTRIDSFMRYEDGIKFASIRSKRLRDVLAESSSSKALDSSLTKEDGVHNSGKRRDRQSKQKEM